MTAQLEHVNITVTDPQAMAETLGRIFGWKVRWSGTAINNGHTVHVGSDDSYLAIYTGPGGNPKPATDETYVTIGALNHIAVTVEDLDATEALVRSEGFETFSHADYEPGRRFYFDGPEGIEFEVVSYR